MKCINCNNEMVNKLTKVDITWGSYTITIDGISAFVCDECGEKMLSFEDSKMVQKLAISLTDIIPQKEILNITETAELLRVSNQSVYNMIKDGRLKAIKIGREWRFMRKNLDSILHPEEDLIAPFPSMVVVFTNKAQLQPDFISLIEPEKQTQ